MSRFCARRSHSMPAHPLLAAPDDCPGISFGPYDAQGARSILFEQARLSRAAVNVETEESVRRDGPAAHDLRRSAVVLELRRGSAARQSRRRHRCISAPTPGQADDLDEDGGRTFRFTNHDGTTLAVSVNAAGALKRVAFGQHECRAPGCGGVRLAPADAEGSRRFSFSGTSLLEKGSDANSAVLNGVVVLAPL